MNELLVRATGMIATQYPYTYVDLRRSRPDVCFPDIPEPDLLAVYGVYPVERVPPPQHDKTQVPVEQMPIYFDGKFRQTWILRPATAEETKAIEHEEKLTDLRNELATTRPQQSVPALVERIGKIEEVLGLRPLST